MGRLYFNYFKTFDRETSKPWDIVNITKPLEFKSRQDIFEELEGEKEKNKLLNDNITALWKAFHQVLLVHDIVRHCRRYSHTLAKLAD